MLTAEGTLIVLGDFAWLTRAMAAAGLLSVAVIAGATKLGFGSVRTYWYATLLFTVLRFLFNTAGVWNYTRRARLRKISSWYAAKGSSVPPEFATSGTRVLPEDISFEAGGVPR